MSRIPAQTLEDAPEQSQLLLKRISEKTGRLMNIHAAMAHRTPSLRVSLSPWVA